MRKLWGVFTAAAVGVAMPVFASNLNIAVQNASDGASSVTVAPSGVVNYRIVGTLSDTLNDGLALWGADLSMSGPAAVALPVAAVPGPEPMAHFVCPAGINNPPCATGYGGTVSGNNLLQVGGGQNTIRNTVANAPFPISADIVQNVAQSQQVLATGSVTMPATTGVYTLAVSNVFANTVNDNTPANPTFYPTSAAGVGTVGSLAITVAPPTPITIVSANPPHSSGNGGIPFRDVLENTTTGLVVEGIGAAGTPAEGGTTYATVSVTFSGTPSPVPIPGNITVACTGGTCPTVTGVVGAGAGPYVLTVSGVVPVQHCTTLTFMGLVAGEKLQYQNLPGDTNLNGTTTGQDVLSLVTAINTVSTILTRHDMNRNGTVTGQDVLRLVQLINGGASVSPPAGYNAATVAACP